MKEMIQLELRKFVAPEFIFGSGARFLAGSYCKKLGGRKVFLATDPQVMATSWFAEIIENLEQHSVNYVIFSSISPNPRDTEVMHGVAVYSDNRCNMILAVGGGSVIDCAKGIGISSTNRENIRKFEGIDMIKHPLPPMVCIPSTGGTAADVSQFAIINNIEEGYKMAIISKSVVPDASLIDPFVLTTMDAFLTACTGIDALSHAIEAAVSNASSPVTTLNAMEAVRLLAENLAASVANPLDVQLRGKVMLASNYAGLAFSNASLGCVHSLAHSLGGYLDLPHGECNAILLPHVVNFNFYEAAEQYTRIADIMGLKTEGLQQKEINRLLTEHLLAFAQQLGVDSTLKVRGVTADIIPLLASKAIKDPCNATNPRPPTCKDLETIYLEAM